MLSVESPQTATSAAARQLTPNSTVTDPKEQTPTVESAIPLRARELLKVFYSLDENTEMYVLPNNPNRIIVVCHGRVGMVDLSSWQAAQQNTEQVKSDDDGKTGPNTSPDSAETKNERAASSEASATPLRPLRLFQRWNRLNGSDWLAAISDEEREMLQRARRRSGAYKTSLCHSFRDTGKCSYGSGCRFAHGEDELRPAPSRHPKYKTQLCNKFALYGSCPYGARCQFIHKYPCQNDDYLPQMNFSTSLDGRDSRQSLAYQYYSRSARFYGQNPCVFGLPTHISCESFPLHQTGTPVGMQYRHCAPEAFYFRQPTAYKTRNQGTGGYIFGPHGIQQMNSRKNSSVDDMFSTMSICDSGSPFTQSCFPRINVDGCTCGSTAPNDYIELNNSD